jgi:hypothetical protein
MRVGHEGKPFKRFPFLAGLMITGLKPGANESDRGDKSVC